MLYHLTDFAYDTKNRLWRIFNPVDPSKFVEFGYEDGMNQRVSTKDELGRIMQFTYTTVKPPGQIDTPFLKEVRDPLLGITRYEPDLHGNLFTVTDAEEAQTTYQFDDMRRLVMATSFDTGATRYWYDPNGNLIGRVDARGIGLEYSYDPLNRLIAVRQISPSIVRKGIF